MKNLVLLFSLLICVANTQAQLVCATTVNTFPYTDGFETAGDFGNWNNVTGDDLSWANGATTPSTGTGPQSGGSSSARFLFVETSGSALNDTGWLASDCFDFTGLTAPFFSFDYHMFGTTMLNGSLRLQITTDDITWTTLWTQAGTNVDLWVTNNQIDLTAYAGQTVRLRFSAVSGGSSTSDASIDNVNIIDQVAMTYTSSTVTQTNTSTVENCASDVEIIGVEVVVNGALTPLDITQLRIRTNGSSSPAITSNVSNIDIYYTGTSSTFATTTFFGNAAPLASGNDVDITGSQTLSSGTNYFWVVYDMSSATINDLVDARCTQITIDGSNELPIIKNPAGTRTIVACVGAPGGISSNLEVWHKADALAYSDAGLTLATDGDGVQQWNDNATTGVDVTAASLAARPTWDEDAINYNPAFNFDAVNDFLSTTGYSLSGNTTHLIVAAPVNDNSNDCLLNIANLGSGWGYNAIYLTTRDGGNRLRFVYRNSPSQSGGNDLDAGTTLQYGQPSIMDFRREQGGLQESWINTSDHQSVNATVGNFSGTSYGFAYGGLGVTTRMFGGKYGEHIKYSSAISNADKNKIDTYLAVKYGITMSDNYVATNGDTIYNTASYANNIIGVGRDDAEALVQKQSHTVDDTSRIYLNTLLTTNLANTGSFAADKSYVLIGDNQGMMKSTAASDAEVPGACGLFSRLEREWKVTRTNVDEDFNIDVVISAGANQALVNVAHLRLLVDNDGDFSNGGTTCYFNGDAFGTVISYSNPVITVAGISTTHIANNTTAFITIASANSATPLPVELTQFNVDCQNDNPKLSWTTESEINNDYFTIERSADAINFEPIAMVDGSGNSSIIINYSWIDDNPISGTSYFRLKQTDYNGADEYHGVKTVSCEQSNNISIYPNPFENNFTVQLSENTTYPLIVEVLDYLGRKVHEQTIVNNTTEITLNDELPTGTYFIKVVSQTAQVVKRIVKIK